ncbi:phage late control D family protein [Leptolyngbya sp. AN03gr2]|uniref:phage late control D family protein n=1 Tax=unclassified Leptolyngbya TaxID=2650499 RepID=UPI003D31AB97
MLNPTASLSPKVRLEIGNTPLPTKAIADIQEVTVSEQLDGVSAFSIRLNTWDLDSSQFTWIDDPLFDCGAQVKVQLGYGSQVATVLEGEITGLEPEFEQGKSPVFIVQGYDVRHRLMRGQKTRTFRQMTPTAIMRQIAQEQGLSIVCPEHPVQIPYLVQSNQSDWKFLQTHAQKIGYEIGVDGMQLHIRPRQTASLKVKTLTWKKDLLEFFPRITTLNQVSAIAVRSWDAQQKGVTITEVSADDEAEPMGTTSGAIAVRREFGASTYTVVDLPVQSAEEAQNFAKGKLEEIRLLYNMATGVCRGSPELSVGKTIEIKGVGTRFSGLYYLAAVEHRYSRSAGYQTEFKGLRSAA